ncbi:MAG: LysM peptidoglycan-binding domain-containing protein, partial [Marinomonas sp.]
MKKYTIKQDDCLSLIAERFDTSIEVLQSLNSDQIKNIDLLYTGDTLVLPGSVDEPLAITTGERIPLPTIPAALPIGTGACESSKPDYVDILYVPSHPSSEKSVWYALTQEAVDAIKSEKDQLASAIVDNDKTKTLQNLNDLGVLSKFEAKAYDQFLDTKDASRYRELLFAQLTLKSGASSLYQHGENSFLFSLASNEGLDLSQLEQEALTWEKAKSNMLTSLSLSSGGMGVSAIAFNEDIYDLFNNEEEVKKRIFRARAKVQKSLLGHLEDEIAKLEKKAIKQAKELESDDGTHFVFDKKNKFFTSAKEHDIDKKIKRLYKNRDYTDKEMALQSQADSAENFKMFWESEVPSDIESVDSFGSYSPFVLALISLNQFGYVVKEQCLTKAELVGEQAYHFGPKCLQTAEFEDWRETGYFSDDANPLKTSTDANGIVKSLYDDVKGELYADKDADEAGIKAILGEAQVAEWAYYPTLALIEVIDETIKKHLNDVKAILGVNQLTIPDFCKRLLWVKKVALGRKKALQKIAKERAQKRNVTLFQGKEDDAELTLIWNETKHLPQKKKLGKMTRTAFKNEAGYADIQIVECSLLSGDEVFYVRGPVWYMPTTTADELKCLKHVKNITGKLGFASASSDAGAIGKTFNDALEALKKPKMPYLNLSGEAKIKDSTFWSDAFHWQGGVGPNGKEAAYTASAQSQFFRFTSSAAANFNTPINDLSNITNQIGVDTNIGAKLNLFNAQLSFSTWLPLKSGNENIQETSPKDVTGYSVKIPYQNDIGKNVY